jgi:hypothetical protein
MSVSPLTPDFVGLVSHGDRSPRERGRSEGG